MQALVATLLIAQANLLTFVAGKPIAVDRAETCLSPACVHAASEILYNLSPDYKELDPCDNFEELVCGGKPSSPNESNQI